MMFASLAVAVLAFALPAFAQTEFLTYDPIYDDASLPLTAVACSNGANGLITKGYTTLGSLPTFPNLGGAYTVANWNSTACGTCYNLTYGSTTISVLAIDTAGVGFNLAEEVVNKLTGGVGIQLGKVQVTSVQVDKSFCGFK